MCEGARARARARVCVCVCVCVRERERERERERDFMCVWMCSLLDRSMDKQRSPFMSEIVQVLFAPVAQVLHPPTSPTGSADCARAMSGMERVLQIFNVTLDVSQDVSLHRDVIIQLLMYLLFFVTTTIFNKLITKGKDYEVYLLPARTNKSPRSLEMFASVTFLKLIVWLSLSCSCDFLKVRFGLCYFACLVLVYLLGWLGFVCLLLLCFFVFYLTLEIVTIRHGR